MSMTAQQPDKGYSIVKQVKSIEWYKEPAAWKNVLYRNP